MALLIVRTEDLPPVDPLLSYIGSVERETTMTSSSSSSGGIGWTDEGIASLNVITATTETTTITTVTCKHGPLECAGNAQQLCFKKYFPDYRVWYPFVVTMNSWHPVRIGDPDYARQVAERVLGSGDNESLLNQVDQCSKSQEGFELLVDSIEHSKHHGVK